MYVITSKFDETLLVDYYAVAISELPLLVEKYHTGEKGNNLVENSLLVDKEHERLTYKYVDERGKEVEHTINYHKIMPINAE